MCDQRDEKSRQGVQTISVHEAAGMVLTHDITEIRPGEFKGRAFRKGQVIKEEDICHLQRLGKEHLFVLSIADDEMHEDDAAYVIAHALRGSGVGIRGEPKEGKIDLIAERDGLLTVDRGRLRDFNMLGDVMCATLHDKMLVKQGQIVAGTRAIPLVVKRGIVQEAVRIARTAKGVKTDGNGRGEGALLDQSETGVIEVRELRRPRAGIVITGNEIYHGRIKDAFAPVIRKKIENFGGEIVGIHYAPDDEQFIEDRLRELLDAGADLLITTGGMSVDPDDVTRFAIRNIGATNITYGSAVLPGAMFLVGYLGIEHSAKGIVQEARNKEYTVESKTQEPYAPCSLPSAAVPILGIPACGMYHKTTIFDLILPRILAGEMIGRRELAELGHGGLCLHCDVCRYPICPFGKD
jgi:molybdenum cofactor synthesis domain-containing protein